MTPYLTFLTGIVLGALIVALWIQRRVAVAEARAAAAEVRATASESRLAATEVRHRELAEIGTVEARVSAVVEPLKDTISRLDRQVRDFEKGREHAFGSIENQLRSLSHETVMLSNSLKAPHARGRWGELTLRRVVELAGMAPYCDFYEQPTLNGAAGRSRPDLLVRLPGGRVLAVDAKAPLTAYQEAANAPDEPARRAALARHAQIVGRHVEQLASKQYWSQIQPSPEMVVLFLPGDHFLSAALEGNPDLLESAIARKVVLATPSTLVSALAGVAHGWREQQVIENAEQIRCVAADVYDRLLTWQNHYSEAGIALDRAIQSYNRSVASWEARLLPSMRKIRELGASGGSEPDSPPQVELAARLPRALEAHNSH